MRKVVLEASMLAILGIAGLAFGGYSFYANMDSADLDSSVGFGVLPLVISIVGLVLFAASFFKMSVLIGEDR